jgi:transcriptional regulator with XRE-family HTH domain
MPRRLRPDPFALLIGQRIRRLRLEAGLTIERLAYESEVGSKGHLSSIEKGLVRPTAHTLKVLADGLGVLPLDLVTLPDADERQELVDRTRSVSREVLRRWLRESERTGARRGTKGRGHSGG